MRKIVLIAAMVLTAAAARADDTRNLSPAAPSDAPAASPAKPADAPRYTVRPAPVDNAPSSTASTEHPERRYDDRGYYDDAGYHPFPRRYTDADRGSDRESGRQSDRLAERPHGHAGGPHHRARWNASRIIGELHRYGVYW